MARIFYTKEFSWYYKLNGIIRSWAKDDNDDIFTASMISRYPEGLRRRYKYRESLWPSK